MGVLFWLALALTGTALIIGGIILFLGKQRVSVRALAGAAVAVGVVMWVALLFPLPVSTTIENHTDPIAAEVLDHPDLPHPPKSRIRGSSGNRGNGEGHLMHTHLNLHKRGEGKGFKEEQKRRAELIRVQAVYWDPLHLSV